jgi:hypothetical protein
MDNVQNNNNCITYHCWIPNDNKTWLTVEADCEIIRILIFARGTRTVRFPDNFNFADLFNAVAFRSDWNF